MATVKLTAGNFAETVGNEGIVIIDFWATWCPPCRAFAPIFERTSEQHPDILFAKVDTDAEQELATEFEIRSIPTVTIIRDGIVVYSRPGMMSAPELEKKIEAVRKLDMDDVRKHVEAPGTATV